ncbi:hypothetical protein ABFS82_02G169700 [Erythranthe guttata]|uniref:Glycosyl transferase family 1 domain-containing protein n=2 Tax=Erythranthe guttata TaxID=4155 RepID=A0A022QU28_ERYGU|nr:PREDICTED: uncharacterized protein LOC105963858 isoform X1 [Erythranthe guttata]EYU32192.1 hypothetical protein MIMGU_mgv1a000786mg [Erythranthe guttata]|eukprot:XP_012843792.1 PREDICTED: uncharacterized protein LOC105963858 isoform X1 [Erythranthe guttata]
MGSLENRPPLKRDHLFHSSSCSSVRSRFARLLLFNKIDYLQLICAVSVSFFFVFLFQVFFLPGSAANEEEMNYDKAHYLFTNNTDLSFLKELGFGEDLKFQPLKLLDKFRNGAKYFNGSFASTGVILKPKLALVFADMWVDSHQILMVTIATALRETGYEFEVFSLEEGPVYAVWKEVGFRVRVINADENTNFGIDWLNYDGILVNSLKAAGVLSSLMQEPFKHVPVIWTIHEQELALRLSGQTQLVDNWRKLFGRATAVVFPNYILPMAYSACDPGNYFVIPGPPAEACNTVHNGNRNRKNNFVVAVVGSQLLYKGLLLENALVLKALLPLLEKGSNNSRLKILVLIGNSTSKFGTAVETIAQNLNYPNGTVNHIGVDGNTDNVVRDADILIYGSFLEENIFPEILSKAMCLGKPIIVPDLPIIQKYVRDEVNGYLFPKENITVLTQIMFRLFSKGEFADLARNAASIGKFVAKNLMVSESVDGYASLLENILLIPSEKIPVEWKSKWKWRYFEAITNAVSPNRINELLDKVERQFNRTHKENSVDFFITRNDRSLYTIWEEQKHVDFDNVRKRREDDELKDRSDQNRKIWDEVYRNARRVDRSLHERDEGELERTGQPLCIYEPYFGEGTWPFLHRTSLYRGIALSTKSRRPGDDDVDAPSRLPLLNNGYYRDVLGEYGAFFAIANRIDRVHKNAWIGFQSWRATASMKSLSKSGEKSLLDVIESRKHGEALYFWTRLDTDPRYGSGHDFWSFCNHINAGNCQFAFTEALKKMYGLKNNSSSLPQMPSNEGTWSVMHCWVLPTRSFMEFVMFSRMFVDALDSQFYDEHHKIGRCYQSLSKDKNCYSGLLELLVNVWAYHSARRMVYVDPTTGAMQEQHKLSQRRGRMWVQWFQLSTLKSMDEDLAEEFDYDGPTKRWIWPLTGEVFWQGIYEKEKSMRFKEKEKKKQQSREKIQRMKKRARQKALGKYVKPVEEIESNSTAQQV